MRRFTLLACVAAAGAVAAVPATADHGCNGSVTDLGVAYIDDRGEDYTWIYAESNSQPGLQSGGTSITLGDDDPCSHPNPDLLIY